MSKIDLNKHCVIEAHAGTGKTWTIINELVLPILQGQGCRKTEIGELLIVTYTEKAAGELKKRIREGLEQKIEELKCQPNQAELQIHLQKCLNNLHEAFIGTIHSVCLRLLQVYPFETGMQFTSEMVDDIEGLRTSLRESIREDWPQWGVDLSKLAGSGSFEGESGIVSRIIEIAAVCLDPDTVLCADGLAPGRDMNSILNDIIMKDELSAKVIDDLKKKIIALEELRKNPNGLNDSHLEIVDGILEGWNCAIGKGILSLKKEIMGKGKGSDYLANKLTKGNVAGTKQNPLINEACRAYSEICQSNELLEWINAGNPEKELLLSVTLKAAPEVCKRWREKKTREGLISFHDMLRLTFDAVKGNAQFRHLLRSKIRFAIIDEFQDTSALQWEIFKRLFVDDPDDGFSPRMFLVGDPKQSIYSFQNAVVESYLDARDSVINHPNDSQSPFHLKNNYRSIPDIINGYNSIFTGRQDGNFFISERITYDEENQVRIPKRENAPEEVTAEMNKPVRIVPVWGLAPQRKRLYAEYVSSAIADLRGRALFLPKGEKWEKIILDYHHFAIIAESHILADQFLDILQDHDIPASKYKQDGVFRSSMAVEFRALLTAIHAPDNNPSQKLKALLTIFFNYHPAVINPDTDLSPGGIVNQLFQKWQIMVDDRLWAQLFRNILKYTGVQERLLNLTDGDRKLCDLRQVMDHSLEYLVRKQGSLGDLIEHLANLESGLENPGHDENLHAKESDKRKVQVMTMHASKGLEFPVCFIVTSGSPTFRGNYRRWTETVEGPDGSLRNLLHIMPVVSEKMLKRPFDAKANEAIAENQKMQERRRLLYVALTRPKALLYIPMHLALPKDKDCTWKELHPPKYNADLDLTPILQKLADISCEDDDYPICVCDPNEVYRSTKNSSLPKHGNQSCNSGQTLYKQISDAEDSVVKAIKELKLASRRRIQTSYSALAHDHHEPTDLGGRRSHDYDSELSFSEVKPALTEPSTLLLPQGKHTGNALHEILECAISHNEGTSWAKEGDYPGFLKEKTEDILTRHGIINQKTRLNSEEITKNALQISKLALNYQYDLPGGGNVCLSSIDPKDMRAEAEFHLGIAPHWVLGYMDLIFRVKNPDDSYRYFVLDWKSNKLPSYNKESIEKSILESRYDLQAKVYCHGLHTWLSGLPGSDYEPSKNLGGALYVYLRALDQQDVAPLWFYKADPEKDHSFVKTEIENYVTRQEMAHAFTY